MTPYFEKLMVEREHLGREQGRQVGYEQGLREVYAVRTITISLI
jgi:hypothetical protein